MRSEAFINAFSKQLTILIGGHGSGKSEFAIMWARRLKANDKTPVVFIDLDTIKPLFRSQEATDALEEEGIKVIISSIPQSDMPAISSQIYGMIGDMTSWRVVDVGGDAVGARILASIRHNLHDPNYNLFYILNASRPFNADAESTIKEMQRIEAVSGLQVTGLISNTHMLDETEPSMIENGINITREISEKLSIEFIGVMVEDRITELINIPDDLELFTIHRMLNPYWLRDY